VAAPRAAPKAWAIPDQASRKDLLQVIEMTLQSWLGSQTWVAEELSKCSLQSAMSVGALNGHAPKMCGQEFKLAVGQEK